MSNPPDDSPMLLDRGRMAWFLRQVDKCLVSGHIDHAREGVEFLARELERDAAMLEQFQLKQESTYVPH